MKCWKRSIKRSDSIERMQMNHHFYFRNQTSWISHDGTHVRGQAFHGEDLLQSDELARRFAECAGNPTEFKLLLEKLNGFFSVVHQYGDCILAAVDIIRSIPLFYGIDHDHILISDDARWVLEHRDRKIRNRDAFREFGMLSCVTADQTLFEGIHQLQAGEMILFELSPDGITRQNNFYFMHLHRTPLPASKMEMLDALDQAVMASFSRLARLAQGRTIAIPLSGGYDSRLVLLALRRLKYDNLITFTYGRPGNPDSVISEKIASTLNVPWSFVPYSINTWQSWYSSEEKNDLFRFADGLSTLPAYSNFPALSALKRSGFLPPDSILVPGIAADLPAGSYSVACPSFYLRHKINLGRVARKIASVLYGLHPMDESDIQFALRRTSHSLLLQENYQDNADAFEEWFTRQKVARFTVNVVRNYEYLDFDWWLPFFDRDFISFWLLTPPNMRLWQDLYGRYLERLSQRFLGFHISSDKTGFHSRVFGMLKAMVQDTAIFKHYSTRKADRNLLDKERIYSLAHNLALFGTVDEEKFLSMYTGRESPYTFNVASYLEEIEEEMGT